MQESRQLSILEIDVHVPSTPSHVLPNNRLRLQHVRLYQITHLNKLAKLILEFYPHPFSFRRYCLYVALRHPLAEHRSDADLKCVLLPHAPLQKILEVDHLAFRHLLIDS